MQRFVERFVDDSEAQRITGTIFIVIGCMVLASVISFLLYYAYTKDTRLFSGILWTIVFVYCVINIAFTAVSKGKLRPFAFRFFIALHSIVALMSMVLFIMYYVRGTNAMRAATVSGMGMPSTYSGYPSSSPRPEAI